MSIRLKNRHQCPPGGFQFTQRETGWNRQAWDFRSLCVELQKHRIANPKFHLPTDLGEIMDEVDDANAQRVLAIRGADIYVVSTEGSPPKLSAPRPRAVGGGANSLLSGIELLKDMLEDDPVAPAVSNTRAAVCVACPQNGRGDWKRYFTVPAAQKIASMLEARTGMKLATPLDDKLGICEACSCPLKLKVHFSDEVVAKNTSREVLDKTPDFCWMKLK